MNEKTFQEYADSLKLEPGRVKAEVVLMQKDYIFIKEGEDKWKMVADFMKEKGVPLEIDNIKAAEWVSDWKSSLMIAACKEVLGWRDEDVYEMGMYTPKASFLIKTVMQYIVSVDILFKNASIYWSKQQDFGDLKVVDYSKEEKYAVIRIYDYKTHPLNCVYLRGYFKGLISFAVRSNNITIEETKCTHKGDDYDEFLIKW
jgi:predicted hydrocarbon binding protein